MLYQIKRIILLLFTGLLISCGSSSKQKDEEKLPLPEPEVIAFGFNLNDFKVVRDTVQRGDTFADIFLENGFSYPEIYDINRKTRKAYNFRKIQPKKAYTFLFEKTAQ